MTIYEFLPPNLHSYLVVDCGLENCKYYRKTDLVGLDDPVCFFRIKYDKCKSEFKACLSRFWHYKVRDQFPEITCKYNKKDRR